jgi:predicted anti-sigma-YlaC factor YlaD
MHALDSTVVWKTFLFGCMWGIGNVNYGLTMRYLGMSLGIGVAIGVTLVVGTLIPPAMHGQLMFLFTTHSGMLTRPASWWRWLEWPSFLMPGIKRNCNWARPRSNSI